MEPPMTLTFILFSKLYCNILKWKGILSDRILKEYVLDNLLGRYIMIGLQASAQNSNTIELIEFVSFNLLIQLVKVFKMFYFSKLIKQLPLEWLPTSSESESSASFTQFVNLSRLIKRVMDTIYQHEVKTNKIDRTSFR